MSYSRFLTIKMNASYTPENSPDIIYDRQFSIISEIDPPWGLKGREKIPIRDGKPRPAVGIRYTQLDGISPIRSFYFGYISRNRPDLPPDAPLFDDTLTIDFNPKKIKDTWHYIFDVAFKKYIEATRPYFGRIYDEQIHSDDVATFDEVSGQSEFNPHYIDWRNGVYRVWQANYWNAELCQRAFALSPKQVRHRLEGLVENCELFMDGVIVIYSYSKMDSDEIIQINKNVLPALGVGISGRRA